MFPAVKTLKKRVFGGILMVNKSMGFWMLPFWFDGIFGKRLGSFIQQCCGWVTERMFMRDEVHMARPWGEVSR